MASKIAIKWGVLMRQPSMRFEFDVHGHDENRWTWRCADPETGSILRLSQTTFQTLYACIQDAEKHGYTSPVVSRLRTRSITAPAS